MEAENKTEDLGDIVESILGKYAAQDIMIKGAGCQNPGQYVRFDLVDPSTAFSATLVIPGFETSTSSLV